MIDCLHWSPYGHGGKCAAGLSGGKPSLGTCGICPHANKPLAELEKIAAEQRYERTHPEAHRGISGCCDPSE